MRAGSVRFFTELQNSKKKTGEQFKATKVLMCNQSSCFNVATTISSFNVQHTENANCICMWLPLLLRKSLQPRVMF